MSSQAIILIFLYTRFIFLFLGNSFNFHEHAVFKKEKKRTKNCNDATQIVHSLPYPYPRHRWIVRLPIINGTSVKDPYNLIIPLFLVTIISIIETDVHLGQHSGALPRQRYLSREIIIKSDWSEFIIIQDTFHLGFDRRQ